MNILAIIPARSGSKSVKNKNIRMINGKPLLAHSIEHALGSRLINRVILSTDSEEYAEIGRKYGAETPFMRPAEYATDTALDIEVFRHALLWLKENEGYEADIVVQLRPTYPKRNPEDIDRMINMLIKDETADSVRSMAEAVEIPYKMWRAVKCSGSADNAETARNAAYAEDTQSFVLTPLLTDIKEAYNMPRQELPKVYMQNACIDVMRGSTVLQKNSMTGDRILGYLMTENLDIDTEAELKKAEEAMRREAQETGLSQAIREGGKRFVFDIDGVIAKLEPNNNYALSEPNTPMIEVVNRLYNSGNEIILHTARGYVTGKDWSEVTLNQLKKWGVCYHELHFGKPNADYYIDDKSLPMEQLMSLAELS